MKKINLILMLFLTSIFVFQSCKKDDELDTKILPTSFSVDIPSSISSSTKSTNVDTLEGNEIYQHLRTFIAVGEKSASIVEEIIFAISVYGLNKPMSFSYVSDDDNRTKNIEIIENSDFENTVWSYQLTITDSVSETNKDKGYAMQIFWNTNPTKGIAILKPYNINRNDTSLNQAIVRIDYSEAGENDYEKQMIVYISDLPLADSITEPYSMQTLKMFAGQKADIIDIYGNSNHPNATFFATDNKGFNWAFVASSDKNLNIAIAEVGLPDSYLNSVDRNIILKDYSIKNVMTSEINSWCLENWGVTASQDTINAYLKNAEAPGYFDNNGFISAGEAPNQNYTNLNTSMDKLSTYNPFEITNLKIEFKN